MGGLVSLSDRDLPPEVEHGSRASVSRPLLAPPATWKDKGLRNTTVAPWRVQRRWWLHQTPRFGLETAVSPDTLSAAARVDPIRASGELSVNGWLGRLRTSRSYAVIS